MLSEGECHLLFSLGEQLMEDFDPMDALPFFEIRGIFTAKQCDEIESKPTRLEKVRALFRAYIRSSDNLGNLISFFEHNRQYQFSSILKAFRVTPLTASSFGDSNSYTNERKLDVLLSGQVPAIRNVIHRDDMQTKLSNLLRKAILKESCFTVVHGMPGAGKTYLAAQTLMEDSLLIGGRFRHVYFLDGSSVTPDQAKNMMADLLLMLSDDPSFNLPPVKNLSSVALMKGLREALVEKPRTLIFLDDVRSVESVRWLDQLGLRVLATTRNLELFDSVSSDVSVLKTSGFNKREMTQYFDKFLPEWRKAQDRDQLLRLVTAVSSANPAVLSKMMKLSGGSCERLKDYCAMLLKNNLKSLSCITPYRYNDIRDAIQSAIDPLENFEQEIIQRLYSCKPDCWIPISSWCGIVPVELCRHTSEEREVYDRLRRLQRKSALLDESSSDRTFKVNRLTTTYSAAKSQIESDLSWGTASNEGVVEMFNVLSSFIPRCV